MHYELYVGLMTKTTQRSSYSGLNEIQKKTKSIQKVTQYGMNSLKLFQLFFAFSMR